MNKKLNVLGVIVLTMPLTALAGQVDSAKITAFTANTPAKAAEVNANFAEQTKQINANSGVMDKNSADLNAIHAAGAGFGRHLLKPLTGLVGVNAQSAMLTGTGTSFTSEVNVGDAIKVAGEVFTIVDILSDFSLTLSALHSVGTANEPAFIDDTLLSVADGNGVAQLTVDKSGDLDVQGTLMRRVVFASAADDENGLDNGQLLNRVLKVVKKKDEKTTALRISYTDNFRVFGQGAACTWTIKVDGQECPNGSLHFSKYFGTRNGTNVSVNGHTPATVSGYCAGLLAGQHEVQVWVGPSSGSPSPTPGFSYVGSDCSTGFKTTWTLESEEVYIN